MIECTINGTTVYPDTSNKIKITYENPYVKDSGSYTYEITFPMYIMANYRFFKGISRFESTKKNKAYDYCRLSVDNRQIISGKGTIKSVTDNYVKIQIVGGSSRIKYNSKWENHYIDEIDYDVALAFDGLYRGFGSTNDYWTNLEGMNGDKVQTLMIDLSNSNMVGSKGMFALSPIADETNDIIANNINRMVLKMYGKNNVGENIWKEMEMSVMFNLAPQPYLMYVLRKVLEFEGYTISANEFDREPWNRLVIANTRKSPKIKDCLPHWSVYNFVDEVRKLFNATFSFDELTRSVKIESRNELLSKDVVTYEPEEEYTSEYDEEGLSNLATSNISYNMGDSANRYWWEVISKDIKKSFDTVDYKDWDTLLIAAAGMTKRERQTRIFHTLENNRYFIWGDFEDETTGEIKEKVQRVGFFSPIIRDIESDVTVELKISPAAMYERKKFSEGEENHWKYGSDKFKDCDIIIPSASNITEASMEDMKEDDNGDYYISIKDAMEGVNVEESSSNDDTVMQVYFLGNNVRELSKNRTYPVGASVEGGKGWWWPVTYTDANMFPDWSGDIYGTMETASMALDALPHRGERMPELIDSHNKITIKFVTDDIPDPSNIYVFRGKRYVCEKVEFNVGNDGVDREKTGYFYEYL